MKFFLHLLKFFHFIITDFHKFLWSKITAVSTKVDILKTYELIFSNSIGGGAETFLRNYLKHKKNCLILRVHSYLFDYYYELHDVDTNHIFYISMKDIVFLLNNYTFDKITINSLVNYFRYQRIIDLICKYPCKKLYMMHDYYCACPVPMLFVDGKYCNFEYCQKAVCFKYNFFALPKITDIKKWRVQWEVFLNSMDEIRCFSENSYNILKNIFKGSAFLNVIKQVPHDMSYCSFSPIVPSTIVPMHVGIIGNMNTEGKGCKIVGEFLKYIKNNNCIEATVIGQLNYKRVKSMNIHYVGKYKLENLQSIVERSGVNCFWFPSLCPETFSYCISEFMQFCLPMICFNVGAQADKVKNYKYGQIISSYSCDDIIMALKNACNKFLCSK